MIGHLLRRGGVTSKRFIYKRKRTISENSVFPPEFEIKAVHDQVNPPQLRLVFLGTGSMQPTKTRNVTASVLQLGGTSWLFDCGEGTQHQVQRCKYVRSSSVNRIYISHLHGDHFYGLPGFMCSLCNGPSYRALENPVEIVGPPGLRNVLRGILKASMVQLSYRYVVHELHHQQVAGDEVGLHPQEFAGKNILSDEAGIWRNIPSSNLDCTNFTVHAATLRHSATLDCFGYVIEERDYPGKLDVEKVLPLLMLDKNKEFFQKKRIKNPMKLLGDLKLGVALELHDRILSPSDVLGPRKKGRKVAILGDTYDSSNIAELAANADLVVHEATNAYLPHYDSSDASHSVNYFTVLRKTLSHGHSIPQMAGSFAQSIRAKHLILTHLSPRYQFDECVEENSELNIAYCNLAKSTFSGKVSMAHDFQMIDIAGSWKDDVERDSIDPIWAKKAAEEAAQVYLDRVGAFFLREDIDG